MNVMEDLHEERANLKQEPSSAFMNVMEDLQEERANLIEAKAKLEEKAELEAKESQYLEQFVRITSHDLQEPLRTISNFARLLGNAKLGQAERPGEEVHPLHRRGRRTNERAHHRSARNTLPLAGMRMSPRSSAITLVSRGHPTISLPVSRSRGRESTFQ